MKEGENCECDPEIVGRFAPRGGVAENTAGSLAD